MSEQVESSPRRPDPTTITTRRQSAAGLRTLKGDTTLAEIGQRSGDLRPSEALQLDAPDRTPWRPEELRTSTVSGWFSEDGRDLPGRNKLLTLLTVFEVPTSEWRAWLEAVERVRSSQPVAMAGNQPTAGLQPLPRIWADAPPQERSDAVAGELSPAETGSPLSEAEVTHTPPAGRGVPRRAVLAGGAAVATLVTGGAILTRLLTSSDRVNVPMMPAVAAPPSRSGSPVDDSTIERVLIGHYAPVFAVAPAQLYGRSIVVSGSDDNTVRVWDLSTGEPLSNPVAGEMVQPPVNLYLPVLAVATHMGTNADGSEWAVGISSGDDYSIRVWSLATGKVTYPPLRRHTRCVRALTTAMVNQQTVIVSGGDDGWIGVWDLDTGRNLRMISTLHSSGITSVAVTKYNDVDVVVSGGYGGVVEVDRVDGGRFRSETSPPLPGAVNGVAATTVLNETIIIAGGEEKIVRAWNLKDGANTRSDRVMAHDGAVRAVTVGEFKNDPIIVSGGNDATVRVWGLANADLKVMLAGHDSSVNTVTITKINDKPVIVSGGDDKTLRIWDMEHRLNY